VPSTSYISSICASPEFATYQTDNKDLQPRIIIHMLGDGVLENKNYQTWMKKFGPNTEQYCSQRIIFNSIAESQLKLSMIDEDRFRVPYYSNQPEKLLDSILILFFKCVNI
ncbi:30999_t:CDS:2, partial [Racocetra persica]